MRIVYLMVLIGLLFGLGENALAKRKTVANRNKTHVAQPTYWGSEQLTQAINQILATTHTKANIGIYVKSMKTGDVLYSHNVNQAFTPASVSKVLTAEAALLYLGPDYQFKTQLLTDAKSISNGILRGNLYIVLSGDPSLTYYDLADLLVSLKSHQIQAIEGNVYIDNTAYDQSFYGPGWLYKDKNYCYGAPISASIINRNCVSFKLAPAKVAGRYAQVVTYDKYFYPNIKNSVITRARSSRSCSIRLSSEPASIISIDGCMPRGHEAWGVSYVVTDVPEYNRALVKSLLKRISVNVYGNVTFGSSNRANLSAVAVHDSKPLRLLINEMLKKSDNVIAGAIFKKLGQIHSHQPGSWENGSVAIKQILSERAGVSPLGLRMVDGSGLSRENVVTPSQLMQVLDFAYHHYSTSYEFVSGLPIAGVDGTLKRRMGNIARKIRAKTGTISGVVSLAGYAVSTEKEPLAFVIMINGMPGMGWRYKQLEDKVATALTRYKSINA